MTPLLLVEGIHVKLECANPTGSVKDRIADFMLTEAEHRGELAPGDTVVEATSGNTGIALARVARDRGYKVLIFMPEHMSPERVTILERLGASVWLTPRSESFAGAVARRDLYRGRAHHYVPDQFGNPDNTRCHRMTTGAEIVAQLVEQGATRIDAFVAGVGTGGTLMGVGEALRAAHPGVKVIAVEPSESAVMSGGPPGDHGIMGIGDGFVPELIDRAELDGIECVTTDEAHAEAMRIGSRYGYCVGMSAGANHLAALRWRQRGNEVVTVWPDCADRYGSLGLVPPAWRGPGCPLRKACAARTREMLGE
jgi:cysteine synthase A